MKKFGAKLDDDSDINVSSPEKLRVIGVELESSLVTMNTEMFVQILAQLSDAIYSLKYFFDFYPPAMEFFFEQSFLARFLLINYSNIIIMNYCFYMCSVKKGRFMHVMQPIEIFIIIVFYLYFT